MSDKGYELLDHTGDLRILCSGKNLSELFSNGARAMMDYMFGGRGAESAPDASESVTVEAGDVDALLVDWLSEILYRSSSSYSRYVAFDIREISETNVIAELGSCPAEAVEDIKAVTYHGLHVHRENGRWQAAVVFDL